MRDATRLTAAVLFQAPWRLQSGFTTAVPRVPLTPTPGGPSLVITSIHGFALATVLLAAAVALLVALAVALGRAGDVLLATACWFVAAAFAAAG